MIWFLAIISIYLIFRGLCVLFIRNEILSFENKFCIENKTKYRFLYYDTLPGFIIMWFHITKSLEYYKVTEKDLKSIYETVL